MRIIKKLFSKSFSFVSKILNDNVPAYSAYVSFFLFISAFPFMMILLAFIKYTPLDKDLLLSVITNLAPGIVADTLASWITEIYNSHVAILSVSVLLALWSASKGILGIVHSINKIYGCGEGRNYFFRRAVAMLYTLVLIVIIIAALVLIVFWNRLASWLGITSALFNLRIAISVIAFFFMFLLLYVRVPNRKTKIRYEIPGALFTTCGWMLFTYLYSIYIDFVNLGNSIYGSLTAIILLLMWLYFCVYILFIGAEINVTLRNRKKRAAS